MMVTNRSLSKDGFSLIELMVTLAIVGILISLLGPAIQFARESARQIECRSHLAALALAAHHHHEIHRTLPTGGWGAQWVGDPDRGYGVSQPGGWVYQILPFIEQAPLRALGTGLSDSHKKISMTEVVATPLRLLNCPTRRPPGNYPSWSLFGHSPPYNCADIELIAKSDYAACVGDAVEIAFDYPTSLSEGDSLYSWSNTDSFTGICFQRSQIRLADVTDGTANTYLYGEKSLPSVAYFGEFSNGDHHGMYAGAVIDTLRSAHETFVPEMDSADTDYFRRFGSAHKSGWNAAFCDGSVRHLNYSMNGAIHRQQGHRNDQ